MNKEQLEGQMKYALEKVGLVWDPEATYALTTPKGVPEKLAKGMAKLATFSPYEGEKLVIMGPQPPVVEEKKGRGKGVFQRA